MEVEYVIGEAAKIWCLNECKKYFYDCFIGGNEEFMIVENSKQEEREPVRTGEISPAFVTCHESDTSKNCSDLSNDPAIQQKLGIIVSNIGTRDTNNSFTSYTFEWFKLFQTICRYLMSDERQERNNEAELYEHFDETLDSRKGYMTKQCTFSDCNINFPNSSNLFVKTIDLLSSGSCFDSNHRHCPTWCRSLSRTNPVLVSVVIYHALAYLCLFRDARKLLAESQHLDDDEHRSADDDEYQTADDDDEHQTADDNGREPPTNDQNQSATSQSSLDCAASASQLSTTNCEDGPPPNSNGSACDDCCSNAVQCRICHEDGDKHTLIQACRCRGTIGLQHNDCLIRWITMSRRYYCEICRYRYQIRRRGMRCLLRWQAPEVYEVEIYHLFLWLSSLVLLVFVVAFITYLSISMSLEVVAYRGSHLAPLLYIVYSILALFCLILSLAEFQFVVWPLLMRLIAVNTAYSVLAYNGDEDNNNNNHHSSMGNSYWRNVPRPADQRTDTGPAAPITQQPSPSMFRLVDSIGS